MMRLAFFGFLLVVVLFGLAFAVENAHTVRFNYFLGAVEVPLSLLLVATMLAGALLGCAASALLVLRLKRELRALKKREATAREEVRALRAGPIKDLS